VTTDEIAAYWASKGYVAIDGYDRQRILDTIREGRHRYAHEGGSQALDEIAATIEAEFTGELGDNPAPSDVLLHVAFSLGPYLAEGLPGMDAINVVCRLADNLARRTSA
jgi:hypothetical protein